MKKNKFYYKSIIIIFGLNGLIYFLIKLFTSNYHLMNLPIDDKIPFLMGFIYFYMIWYPYIIGSLYIIYKYNRDKYSHVLITMVLSLLTLYISFIVYPTMVIRPEVNSFHNLTEFITYVTFKTDTPTSCFPSGHCLLCFIVLFATWNDKKIPLYIRIPIIIVNFLIIASTVFTKQHVFIDVIGSLILSLFMYYYLANTKYFKKIKEQLNKY